MYDNKTMRFYEEFVKDTNKKSKKSKIYYYNLLDIMKEICQYYLSFGIRSNGKTTAPYVLSLIDYCFFGNQLGLIRRNDIDFKGKKGREMFKGLASIKYKDQNLIEYLTNGQYDDIVYYSSQWFLCKFDESLGKKVMDGTPFAHAFAISTSSHDKSISYPRIKTILFDEFISKEGYLDDEFVKLMNTISTIVRERKDITIFMCGNSVNKYNPYFKEMGLYNASKMKPDTIEYYTYGETGLKVGIEFTAIDKENKQTKTKKKPSDVYFAFDNPKLKMITTGAWEIDIYPHLQTKYDKKDIKFTFFIKFEENLLQCELIQKDNAMFVYVHKKTTKIKNEDKELIYQQEYSYKPNHSIDMLMPRNNIEKIILQLYRTGKFFYQDNEIGEVVKNYILWTRNH